MVIKCKINPTILEGYGTMYHAKNRIYQYFGSMLEFTTFSSKGNFYQSRDSHYAYVYNIEIYKRKQNRKKPHYKIWIYKINLELIKEFNLELEQKGRYFKIRNKKR